MKDIFEKRLAFKPNEYPELLRFKDAIRHSYWLHTEFNVESDVQNFLVNISDSEREAIKRAMLAISQIEISVKTFWADIYKRMPKPEIGAVGMTFAESEVRHADAYAFLLERLGLNDEFNSIMEVPAIKDRVNYLTKYLSSAKSRDNKKYALAVLLFAVFIEHVSLFSQFLIMMSFNKHKKMFSGLSNIVEATSKEEEIHGQFGVEIVKIIKFEFPDWFDEDFTDEIVRACRKAEKAECKILDWIFEKGELEFMSKDVVKNFIKNRFNSALSSLGINPIFEVSDEMLNETVWFDEEMIGTKENDFFVKRSTAYSKKTKSITEDDLF
jgi:ribonucleoside-diphosphate reductase beta chain